VRTSWPRPGRCPLVSPQRSPCRPLVIDRQWPRPQSAKREKRSQSQLCVDAFHGTDSSIIEDDSAYAAGSYRQKCLLPKGKAEAREGLEIRVRPIDFIPVIRLVAHSYFVLSRSWI